MVSFVTGLRCRECQRAFPAEALHVCDYCFGPLEVAYDYERIAASVSRDSIAAGPRSIWRYRDLLPVDDATPVDLGAGFTPLIRADRLAAELGLGELWIKDDTANPTGSFKDRVVSVALTKARQLGFKVAACASTGNLANSVAAHAARAGMDSVVLIPHDLETAKVTMTAVYGGTVIAVEGNYDDVNRLCAELTSERPSWAFVNVNVRTYYAEGSKTLAFEIAEQLGWQAPDHVVVPIGSGSQLTKVAKGFSELGKVGLLPEEPAVRVSGAQAEGCSPVATAFLEGHRRHPAGQAQDDRQVAGHRQPGGRVVRPGRHPAIGRVLRHRDRRRDRRRHRAAGPHRGDLRRDRRRGDHRHPGQAGRLRGHPPRRARGGPGHRARPQDGRSPGRRTGQHPHGDDRPHPGRLRRRVGRPRDRQPEEQGDPPMSVTVRIPTQLRTLTGGAGEVEVEGSSVGEALKALDAAHPGLAERLFDDAGNLRRFVNVFLADEDVRFLDGLATPVTPGQTLSIVPAVAGG